MSKEELVGAYLRGEISRRIFIRRLVSAGVSLSAALAYVEIAFGSPKGKGDRDDFYDLYDFYGPKGSKVSTHGRITAKNGDEATFVGNARKSKAGQPKGQVQYEDHGPAQRVKLISTKVSTLRRSSDGKQASVYGLAKVNGSRNIRFQIDVKDRGNPGAGKDTYRIRLSSGYDSGEQKLESGDIEIRTS